MSSTLVGTISGALVAGGVYYAFSEMIQTQTTRHRADLHALSQKLLAPPASTIPAPLPAAARIAHDPFKSLLKSRWNEEVEGLVKRAGRLDERLADWGRKVLYGGTR